MKFKLKNKSFLKKTISIFFVFLFTVCIFPSIETEAYSRDTVLFISSYSYDWGSVPRQIEGIESAIDGSCEIIYRFMNTKNVSDELAEDLLYRSLTEEVGHGMDYDAVILGDDAALNFAMKYNDEFFSDVPVVYFGINAMDNAYYATETYGYTGVIEQFSVTETVMLARSIYTDATRVVGIVDGSVSGMACEEQFWATANEFDDIEFSILSTSNYTYEELENIISDFDESTILIYLIFNEDGQGNSYSSTAATKFITETAKIPVFRTDDLGLGDGILGGAMISQKSMGEDAAEMVVDILDGTSISDIEPTVTSAMVCFDESVMKKFGINDSQIPDDAVIINQETSFFEKNAEILSISLIIILILIILLLFILRENKKIKGLNDTLGEREQILNSLIDSIVFKVSSDNNVSNIYYSDGIPSLSGRSADEYDEWLNNGMQVNEYVYKNDVTRYLESMEALITGRVDSVSINFRLQKVDGDLRWVDFYAAKIREEGGETVFAGIYTQISDEAKMYRKIINDSSTGVFVTDDKTNNLLYVNNAMYNMGIVKGDKVIGHKCYEVFYGKDKPCDFCKRQDLSYNTYTSFERFNEAGDKHYVHRARRIDWNGISAHIEYITENSKIYFANRELELNRKTLNEAIRHSGMGFWEYYPDENRAVWESPNATRFSGDEKSLENFPECWFEKNITAPESVDTLRKFYDDAKNGEPEGECEIHNIVGNESGWERLRFATMCDDKGERIKVIIASIDITNEKKAEEKFQAELARKSALGADSTISVEYNVTDDYVIEVTGEDSAMLKQHCTAEECVKDAVEQAVLPRLKDKALHDLSRDEMLKNYENNRMNYPVSLFIKRSDKEIRNYLVDINMTKEPKTNDIYAFIYARDDTENWLNVHVIQSAVEKGADMVSFLNVKSGISRLVRCKKDVAGVPEEGPRVYDESIKEHIENHIPPEEREECLKEYSRENIIKQLETNSEYSIIHSIYSDSSHTDTRRVKMIAYYLDRAELTIVFIRNDITDVYNQEQEKNKQLKTALKEAELANAAKSDFLSNMSHEIRTPMNAVLGLASIGAKESDNEQTIDYFDKISASGKYLLGLINDILDMSKIESQKIDLDLECVDVGKLVDDIATIVVPLCEKKDIKMETDVSDLDEKYGMLDPIRTQQILINLLGNAVKFSHSNSKIEFNVSSKDGYFEFVVRDYGVGMSEEFVERAFIPFEQEKNQQTSRRQGTGLGLAISKNLAELMNGTISVSSKLGEGSTFTVEIPIVAPNDYSEADNDQVSAASDNLSGKRVLVAEDHPINTEIIIKVLENRGIIAEHASDGAEAVKMFESSKPFWYDAVFMDIRMPNMDGIEATKLIRGLNRTDCDVPIIAMTANTLESDIKVAKDAGMNAYVSKPIDVTALFETLERFV